MNKKKIELSKFLDMYIFYVKNSLHPIKDSTRKSRKGNKFAMTNDLVKKHRILNSLNQIHFISGYQEHLQMWIHKWT